MWNRLKNHLIWSSKDFPFTRQSRTKKPDSVWIRPSGLIFPSQDSVDVDSPEPLLFCSNPEPAAAECRKRFFFFFSFFFSLSLHYSSSSPFSFLIFPQRYLAPSTLVYGFGLPSPESSRKYKPFEASFRWNFQHLKEPNLHCTPPPIYICEVETPWSLLCS